MDLESKGVIFKVLWLLPVVQITNMHSLKKNMERKNAFSRGHFFCHYQRQIPNFRGEVCDWHTSLPGKTFCFLILWNFQCIFFQICAAEYISIYMKHVTMPSKLKPFDKTTKHYIPIKIALYYWFHITQKEILSIYWAKIDFERSCDIGNSLW